MKRNTNHLRRFALFFLCGMLLASLAACGQEEPELPVADKLAKTLPEPPERWPAWEEVPAYLQELYAENAECIGWLKIDGTQVDYPVMQSSTEDPEFYLNRNFYGASDANGIPFMEARCSADPLEAVSLLYGHNMLNEVAFSTLLRYESEAFRDEYPYIQFDTMVGPGLYEVVGVFWYDASGSPEQFQPHHDLTLATEERFDTYVAGLNEVSAYERTIEAEPGDQFLLLMTCDRRVIADGRMFVVAQRV